MEIHVLMTTLSPVLVRAKVLISANQSLSMIRYTTDIQRKPRDDTLAWWIWLCFISFSDTALHERFHLKVCESLMNKTNIQNALVSRRARICLYESEPREWNMLHQLLQICDWNVSFLILNTDQAPSSHISFQYMVSRENACTIRTVWWT